MGHQCCGRCRIDQERRVHRGPDGALWCASSVAAEALPAHSPRRAGKAGGVRFKRIALNPDHWDTRQVACNPSLAAQWFKAHEGELYDWQLILGFVSWAIPQKSMRWPEPMGP